MFENAIPLESGVLPTILQKRIKYGQAAEDVILQTKIITEDLTFNDPMSLNPQVSVGTLIFDKCIFNGEVRTPDFHQAGKIVFRNCLFKAKVTIATTAN